MRSPARVKQNALQGVKVLVIDDEPAILEMLNLALALQGFSVIIAQNAAAGLRAAYQNRPDAILLDVMMPDVDGYEVCRRLREMTDVPIIFVTAKDKPEDILHGFSVGADEYLLKPFEVTELLERLRLLLQRVSEQPTDNPNLLFVSDSMMLNSDRREMVHGNQIVHFTPLEFEVLRLLVHHAGKVLSPEAILTHVWGFEQASNHELVKQYIYRLRRKIEADPESPRYLQTVWGEGYYFDIKASAL